MCLPISIHTAKSKPNWTVGSGFSSISPSNLGQIPKSGTGLKSKCSQPYQCRCRCNIAYKDMYVFRADKKFKHSLDGIGDGCDVCPENPRLFSDPDKIRAGFEGFRSIGMYL